MLHCAFRVASTSSLKFGKDLQLIEASHLYNIATGLQPCLYPAAQRDFTKPRLLLPARSRAQKVAGLCSVLASPLTLYHAAWHAVDGGTVRHRVW